MLKKQFRNSLYSPLRKKYDDAKKRKNFKQHVRDSDVFVVGHPKSGNTWLCRMIACLLQDRFQEKVNLSNIRKAIPALHNRDDDIERYADFPDPRVFRNEGPIYPDLYPKTIYILRDPRSAYVSYYHHCVHDTQNLEWRIEDFIDEMLNAGCIKQLEPYLIRWDKQVVEWIERSKSQPTIFVKYEDMHQDKEGVLVKVANFIGIEYNQEMIDNALEKSTFKNMRKEEITFGAEPYSGGQGEKGFYVRKGKTDGWKDELPQPCVHKIQREFNETMRKFKYI